MMLTPWNIPCDANTLRGQLMHSWLENEILDPPIEDVIDIWQKADNDMLARHAGYVKNLTRLTESLVDGFSPRQLVDTLKPFDGLSKEDKIAIKASVHEAYLESSGILALQASLKASAMDMGEALQELSYVWGLSQHHGEGAVRMAWKGMQEKARRLIMIMECLPKGVVLP